MPVDSRFGGLQKEDEIRGSSDDRNGVAGGMGFLKSEKYVRHERWLSLARPGQGLGVLLDPEIPAYFFKRLSRSWHKNEQLGQAGFLSCTNGVESLERSKTTS